MANTVRKTFYSDGVFAVPAGIYGIRVTTVQTNRSINASFDGFADQFARTYTMGLNTVGQIGQGSDVVPRSSPTLVVGGQSFASVFYHASNTTAYGLTTRGDVYSWGSATGGMLGDGTTVTKSSPVLVVGGYKFQTLAFSANNGVSTIGLTTLGKAYAWGQNTAGQLGTNDVTPRSSPTLVVGNILWNKIVGTLGDGSHHGIDINGSIYGWGTNADGQIGDGTSVAKSSPTLVVGGQTYRDIVAGSLSVYGLTTAGAAYAWGSNASGQLGDNSVTKRSSPIAVVGGLVFQQLFVPQGGSNNGNVVAFGIAANGNAYAWGINTNGQLGVGDTTARSSPTLVVGGLKFQKIVTHNGAGNVATVFGLTTDGKLYGWGANANGQIGDNSVAVRSSPTLVVGGLNWVDVMIQNNNAVLGVTTQGLVYGWGINTNGELGVGDVTPRSSPTLTAGVRALFVLPKIQTVPITTVPGTNLTVTKGQYFATVGQTVVGIQPDSIIIEYEQ